MTDPLRELVNEYDSARNTPRLLRQTQRPPQKRLACVKCLAAFDGDENYVGRKHQLKGCRGRWVTVRW